MNLLDRIDQPSDLRRLSEDQLEPLSAEVREFIISALSVKAGHLGASLGTVELSVALHYVFNTPKDSLIWDVGHQAYGHKILTGRKGVFNSNRQWGGISGFPKREESVYDSFGTGHSSTALSAALGMALADPDPNNCHIAVVGDAAIASGMAFEGLNHSGATNANLILILNDNHMGIDPSVGALKTHFEELAQAKNNLFTALGFSYSGPIDGHDLPELLSELKKIKAQKGPRVLHIKTVKGKGLAAAELDQITYHAPGTFDRETGVIHKAPTPTEKFQDILGKTLGELMGQHQNLIAISPAMTTGSGLAPLMKSYPDRVIDVGIAEQHALTLAGGIATKGSKAFCIIYSTFLQRAMDQLIHDIALQKLAVVLCIDRAGLVGNDGATHQGVFDIALLLPIPNMVISAPKDANELRDLIHTAHGYTKGPFAIRYPRGNVFEMNWEQEPKEVPLGKGVCLKEGTEIAVITTGICSHTATKAIAESNEPTKVAHYHFAYIKPLDESLIKSIGGSFKKIITLEDGVIQGGFGQAVAAVLVRQGICIKLTHLGVPDRFVEHGNPLEQQYDVGLDYNHLKELLNQ
jgi:1-deoxy-D-xylulose-5-phosphate synthase